MKLKNEKFYLILPVVALPFLCLIFYGLGGGKAAVKSDSTTLGINSELPKVAVDAKKQALDKMALYEKVGQDSMVRRKFEKRDSFVGVSDPVRLPAGDAKAEDLLRQLNRLQQTLGQPRYSPAMGAGLVREKERVPAVVQDAPVPEADPQLEKIDRMLEKVIRIQHPGELGHGSAVPPAVGIDEVLPVDSSANAVGVVVPEKQVLTTGATIALRLQDSVRVAGSVIPSGQMVYGVVSVNNDRMLIHINSIRSDRNLYAVDLQVYDLGGLPGIHIPGQIGRDVAKQSTDQGISSLNLTTYDPSIGGQAANAGIQAAKSLFGRKVRQVRVTVRAGYRLLLRDPKAKGSMHVNGLPGVSPGVVQARPPGFVPGGPFLKHFSSGGMELDLMGLYLKDEKLWFCLALHNGSPISYVPEYVRWYVRDRQVMRRTAVQEVALTPVFNPELVRIDGDSTVVEWTGFVPFALASDKELVVEFGEKNGGRVLNLVISHKQILRAQKLNNGESE